MPPGNQRVLSLVNYIKQNSSVQLDVLKSSSIIAGYTEAEFQEALNIISGNQNQASTPQPVVKQGLPLKIIIGALLILVLTISGVSYLTLRKPTLKTSTAQTQASQQPVASENPDNLSNENLLEEPNRSLSILKTADYKVTTHGKFVPSGPDKFSAELDGMVFYLKNGAVNRVDYKIDGQDAYAIFFGESGYVLSPSNKSYYDFTPEDWGDLYWGMMNGFPLSQYMDNQTLVWVNVGANEWQSKSKLKPIFLSDESEYIVKLTIDPKNNLVNFMSIKLNQAEPWQTVSFTYEKLAAGVLDSLLVVPPDYQKKQIP